MSEYGELRINWSYIYILEKYSIHGDSKVVKGLHLTHFSIRV